MTESDLARDLAHRADAAARAVEGVVRLYSATPIPARLARQITRPGEDAPLAAVEHIVEHEAALEAAHDPEQLAVTVHLGVSALRAAPTTARLVADAVRAELADHGRVHVHVQVSRVTEE